MVAEPECGPMILNELIERVGVSSVLQKNTSCYGKQFLFDGLQETCWNSEAGPRQWIRQSDNDAIVNMDAQPTYQTYFSVQFQQEVLVSKLEIRFQGGFCGKDAATSIIFDDTDKVSIHPEDSNKLQQFEFSADDPNSFKDTKCSKLKIVFEGSTDFYGRVIVYSIDIYGRT